MRVIDIITRAVVKVGIAESGAIPTTVKNQSLLELNGLYEQMYNANRWRDTKIFSLSATTTDGIIILPNYVDDVTAVRQGLKPLFPIGEVRMNYVMPNLLDTVGTPVGFMYREMSPVLTQPSAAVTARIKSSSASDTTEVVRIEGTVSGDPDREELTLNGTSNVDGTKSFSDFTKIVKPQTVGKVTILDTSDTEYGEILPDQYQGHYRRIEVVANVDVSTTYHFMCIRRFQPLVSDNDAIPIPLLSEALFHGLTAALYEEIGNEQSAQRARSQSAASLQLAIDKEVRQSLTDDSIVPSMGLFGNFGAERTFHTTDFTPTGIWS